MKIAVLGSGNVGGTLGRKWAQKDHQVIFGVRDPQATKVEVLLTEAGNGASAATLAGATQEADVVVVAIPGSAVPALAKSLSGSLDGKIIIDATNNVGQPEMDNLEPLSRHAQEATFYRAFNSLGWENFAEPVLDGIQADLFFCGDDGPERAMVEQLIADIGLRPIYVGGLDQKSIVDNVTRLWFVLALSQGRGRHLAFKMLEPAPAS